MAAPAPPGAILRTDPATGDVTIGPTGYVENRTVPAAAGKINGVNITALNARTRTSAASAVAAVSTWTTRASAADTDWYSVCWAPELSLFVAVSYSGTGNRVATSSDGISWVIRVPAVDNSWLSVCWAPELSLFVAVAQSGTGDRVMTSPDGVTWTTRSSAADIPWQSVCWASELSLFVAVANGGTGNNVMTSSDGITWTTRPSAADNGWLAVCWSPELSLFAAVGRLGTGSRVMTSPDGLTWQTRATTASNNWQSVCWAPEVSLFVAVSETGAGDNVMTSPDGISWTTRACVNNGWHSVCWAPELSLFVAVARSGTGNRIMTSPNGVTWTTRASAADISWRSICWSPELSTFVAVANSGTGNRVMTSAIAMPNSKSVVKALPSQMMVTADGKVGVGTTTPTTRFVIGANTTANEVLTIQSQNYAGIEILSDTANTSGEVGGAYIILSQDAGAVSGSIGMTQRDNEDGSGKACAGTLANHFVVSNRYPSGVVLASGDAAILYAERGNVGIGTHTPLRPLHINGSMRLGTLLSGTGGVVYRNTTNGDFVNASSDSRLKTDVRPIPDALSRVQNMRGVLFKWTNANDPDFNLTEADAAADQIGFIAQEVEPVCPELVYPNGTKDYKAVRYAETTALLVEAVKELSDRIGAIETRLSAAGL